MPVTTVRTAKTTKPRPITATVVPAPPDTTAIQKESTGIVRQATAIVVADAASYEIAGDFLRTIKTAQNKLDTIFDPSIDAAHRAHKAMLDLKKGFAGPLKEAETTVKERRRVWFAEQERIRYEAQVKAQREAEAEARKAQEAEAAKLRQARKFSAAKAVAAAPVEVVAPVVQSAVPLEDGIGKTKRWYHKVVDATLVPREYLVVDEVALGKLARAPGDTKPTIPGVVFEFEYNDAVRAWHSRYPQ